MIHENPMGKWARIATGTLIVVVVYVLLKTCVIGLYRVDFRDEFVVSGEIFRLPSLLNVHSSHPRYVRCFGKFLPGVRGSRPYYLHVYSPERLIFVTERLTGRVALHIFTLPQGSHIKIDADGAGFGGHIGEKQQKDSVMTEYVEENGKDSLILVKISVGWMEKYFVDLRKRTIRTQTTFFK